MERYIEISTADLFQMILSGEDSDVYVKWNGKIFKANSEEWKFSELIRNQWFKREVIE
ncbi:hypothetical protein [Oceanobacillus oncorhynchi]|uniref:hypothetical protein n=1 Tax=Oceanobacillus oncorhynchi TaxID=545501 RepID=UPI0018665FC5|nr:hypothetical protein [Oceanobacillus oncorhynchi]